MKRITPFALVWDTNCTKRKIYSTELTIKDNSENFTRSDVPQSTLNWMHKLNANTLAAINKQITNLELGISSFKLRPNQLQNLPIAIRISSLLLECLAVVGPKLSQKDEQCIMLTKCFMWPAQ